MFDRTSAQAGTAITHADSSADVTITEPGTYYASYSGTAAPQTGASYPESNLITFTLNGTTLDGTATQHIFTADGQTSAQSAAQLFTVTDVPATLQVVSGGGDYLYSNTTLNVIKIG